MEAVQFVSDLCVVEYGVIGGAPLHRGLTLLLLWNYGLLTTLLQCSSQNACQHALTDFSHIYSVTQLGLYQSLGLARSLTTPSSTQGADNKQHSIIIMRLSNNDTSGHPFSADEQTALTSPTWHIRHAIFYVNRPRGIHTPLAVLS